MAFLRQLIALLKSRPDTPFVGQPKPSSLARHFPWDIAYFIEFYKPKLGEHHAEFLTALIAALNDRAKLPELNSSISGRNNPRPTRHSLARSVAVPAGLLVRVKTLPTFPRLATNRRQRPLWLDQGLALSGKG